MSQDEVGTLFRLNSILSEVFEPCTREHSGRIVKKMGDGLLVEFPSALEAVECAVSVQSAVAERNKDEPFDRQIAFRMGINVGDVIEATDHDIYGDAVNIAARLESIAEPGSICISRSVRDQIRDRLHYPLQDLGEQQVKNIARPIRVWRVLTTGIPRSSLPLRAWRSAATRILLVTTVAAVLVGSAIGGWVLWGPRPQIAGNLTRADANNRVTIAVLPLTNLSIEASQDYFVEGLTEDIINALSRFPSLAVFSKNAVVSTSKGTDIHEHARSLGARFLVEGDVRRSSDRLRVSIRLTDAHRGELLWSERYDEQESDVFTLQDRITRRIAGSLAIRVGRIEQNRSLTKPTQNLAAYDYVLRGRKLLDAKLRQANSEARDMFEKAAALDQNYAEAYVGLAETYHAAIAYGWSQLPRQDLAVMEALTKKARMLNDRQPSAHRLQARVHLFKGQQDLALAHIERVLDLNPSDALSYADYGNLLAWSGRPNDSIRAYETAMRFDPTLEMSHWLGLGIAYYLSGRHNDGIKFLRAAVEERGDFALFRVVLAASYVEVGRVDEARAAAQEAMRLAPFFSAKNFAASRLPDAAQREKLINSLRQAGFND